MNPKNDFILLLLLFSFSGCVQSPSTPEETVNVFLQHIVNQNYDAAFSFLLESDGKPLSDEAKKELRGEIEKSAISSFKVGTVSELNSAEYSALRQLGFKEAKKVSFSVTEKNTQAVSEAEFVLIKQDDSWKILFPRVAPAPS